MNNYDEIKELSNLLFSRFNSLTLTTEQTSQATNRSVMSLQRDRREAVGIPYTKLGRNSGSDKALYNVMDIAKFIVTNKIKTA